ncbi:hypothetical protein LTR05_003541 [Lithohypha guttulata]|uniref:Uncharacterized protein n=1 Tax=Lithohypha guttulata TaxID=1690604 RepID=A0AAN7T0S5_9EURO|nr:hypothetical protein LTR05_003541 [Lithohypha guttulata]
MAEPNYHVVPSASIYFPEMTSCLPVGDDTSFPGNDGSYIPTSGVAPTDLTFIHPLGPCDSDTSGPSSGPLAKPFSPPMTEAEIAQAELYHTTGIDSGMAHLSCYPDQWVMQLPPTPPADPMFEIPDLFDTGRTDSLAFEPLPEPATECEYLGVSKLQFSRAPIKHSNPRPIRSASERSPPSSATGSPKERHMERSKHNPRNDPRYDVKPDKDGNYHCPYAADNCNHKPTKQKCIYAKNLDSHLKPYTCKFGDRDENCRPLRFSSNACLFRHEREMHGLHNHGINPYLCKFEGCERARRDNGFPRRWNQRDHMKRVHGWEEPENDEIADRGYTDPSRRRKGPGASTSVAMKRNSSARAHPYLPGHSRNVSAPRYHPQLRRDVQTQNIMMPGMTVDHSHYGPMVTQSFEPGMYLQSVY